MSKNKQDFSKRLQEAVDYLKREGIIYNQQDLAEVMGQSRENISRSLNGSATQKFVIAFSSKFKEYFNVSYLLTGQGNLLKNEVDTSILPDNNIEYHALKDLFKDLLNMYIEMQRENDKMVSMLEKYESVDETIRAFLNEKRNKGSNKGKNSIIETIINAK